MVLEPADGGGLQGDEEVDGLRRRGGVVLEPPEKRAHRADHGLAAEAGIGRGGGSHHRWRRRREFGNLGCDERVEARVLYLLAGLCSVGPDVGSPMLVKSDQEELAVRLGLRNGRAGGSLRQNLRYSKQNFYRPNGS
ncbi:hypothetical protein TRIUR3_23404 [Triticum urartu]|uniref:Uncharacterized protein n=1 Tax=Triticum urartu TaxID=4572 RepID=M7Z6R8_TRIUA|nr:hypothetical protein TRIUR3_23404 [Triticum urartu]